MVVVVNWVVGAEVTCPKCGKPGKVGKDRFTWKGRVYYYWTVRHYEDGRVKRCVIQRAEEGVAAGATPAARARPAKRAAKARRARLQAEKPTPAPAAPAPAPQLSIDVKAIVEEAVKAAVAEALKAVNAEMARVLAEAVSSAVREALAAVRAELEQQRAVLQRIEDSVRQRKGEGAKAVQRGEVKITLRPGSLHYQIIEVLRGRELTKEQIAAELERRFNRRVSGNSLSGRLSELRGAGYVECVRRGRTWLWRLAAGVQLPAVSSEKPAKEEPRREEPARQPARSQPPAYVARSEQHTDIPAGSSQAGLPSFAVDNPWLTILAGRGEADSASTTNSAVSGSNSGLPSFVVDNPWLEVLSGKAASSGRKTENAASVNDGGLPSFAADNPWLAILARR